MQQGFKISHPPFLSIESAKEYACQELLLILGKHHSIMLLSLHAGSMAG